MFVEFVGLVSLDINLALHGFIEIEMSRRELVTALCFRSSHVPLNKLGYLMSKIPSPNCETCVTTQDVYHAIIKCVNGEIFRLQIPDLKIMCSGDLQQHLGQPLVKGDEYVV